LINTGSSDACVTRPRFRPDLSSGFEAQHLGNPNELHVLRAVDGKPSA
jgi:hypothetical protein